MNILGIADGTDAGAALIVDDRVVAAVEQERLDRRPHSRGTPWAAADEALKVAGLSRRDVDMVAIAGRFSPPFFLRRHPRWRLLARDAFSPLLDVTVFYQACLRQSGLGALEADRTAEWFHQQLEDRGFGMRRTLLVDVHRCLAEAAHRCQPREPVLVLTLHPNGDGVALATYRGSVGPLKRQALTPEIIAAAEYNPGWPQSSRFVALLQLSKECQQNLAELISAADHRVAIE